MIAAAVEDNCLAGATAGANSCCLAAVTNSCCLAAATNIFCLAAVTNSCCLAAATNIFCLAAVTNSCRMAAAMNSCSAVVEAAAAGFGDSRQQLHHGQSHR